MKNSLFLILFCFSIIGIQAQNSPYVFTSADRSWNKEIITNSSTKVVHTSKIILNVKIDSVHNILYLILVDFKKGKPKDEATVVAYDLISEAEIWSHELSISDNHFSLLDTIPSISDEASTQMFSRETGELLRKYRGAIVFLVGEGKVGVAHFDDSYNNWLVGVNMITGKIIWESKTKFNLVSDELFLMSDTSITFFASDLLHINLMNGEGFTQKIGMPPFAGSAIFAGVVGGLVGGAIGGAVMMSVAMNVNGGSGKAIVGNQHKNWIVDSTGIYLANLKDLTKYDFRGNVIWENPMPQAKKTTGFSKLFFYNNSLYMINDGREYIPDQGAVYGPMFAVRMNKERGKVEGYLDIKTSKREYMNDYLVRDNSLLFALNERMLEVDVDNFEIINERVFNTGSTNLGLKNIVNPPYYLKAESVFYNPLDLKPNALYIENSVGMKIEFSEAYELKAVVKKRDFYNYKTQVGDFQLIGNGADYYLIDSTGSQINSLKFSANAHVVGDYFVDFKENEIFLTPVFELGK